MGQLDISGETNTARTVCTPEPPTDAVRMTHNATFRSEIGVHSVSRIVDEISRWRILCRNSTRNTCSFEQWQKAKLSHASHLWKRVVEWYMDISRQLERILLGQPLHSQICCGVKRIFWHVCCRVIETCPLVTIFVAFFLKPVLWTLSRGHFFPRLLRICFWVLGSLV